MASTPRTTGVEYMEPHVEWIDSENVHVLVSGFKREELRVQVTSTGKLKISGERVVDGGRVSRFEKEIRIPNDCDVNGITAKYESEILQLRLPKSTTAAVADHKHSHELPSQPQLADKHSHEAHLPEKRSGEAQPQPQLPAGYKTSHETHLTEKSSHDAQTQLPAGYKTSHETQLHEKYSQLPDDKSSREERLHESWIPVPDKHRPEDKAAAVVAAKHNVADQRARETTEATGIERSRHERRFDGVRAGRLGMELETRKTKVTIVLAVVGALVVGYLSGRLDQAVRDGWTIVKGRS